MRNDHIASLRREYQRATLDPGDMPEDPIWAFNSWFELALAENCVEPNALVLSTADTQGRPSSRVVLLKDCTEAGLVFYTNYHSRKGKQLSENPWAAMNFFWAELERQVRIEGKIEKVESSVSDAYFASRPRLSQAGAIVSAQSTKILGREALDAEMKKLMSLPESEVLQRPVNWGGFCLVPEYFEFWQGRAGRVHDRISYELNHGHWEKFRLSP